ncbi:hypothetical protein CesoFtcFv8_027381 [Champsocephalus esox]|uniref:Uncharacterized protein n=1 Tax=Champsocephalus esox TaxID=159716 RepID=A0AAN7YJ51_9TELE|nr:hypothetical protein CesoFtcFv8_027381 [Champsocephalus esox]
MNRAIHPTVLWSQAGFIGASSGGQPPRGDTRRDEGSALCPPCHEPFAAAGQTKGPAAAHTGCRIRGGFTH